MGETLYRDRAGQLVQAEGVDEPLQWGKTILWPVQAGHLKCTGRADPACSRAGKDRDQLFSPFRRCCQ